MDALHHFKTLAEILSTMNDGVSLRSGRKIKRKDHFLCFVLLSFTRFCWCTQRTGQTTEKWNLILPKSSREMKRTDTVGEWTYTADLRQRFPVFLQTFARLQNGILDSFNTYLSIKPPLVPSEFLVFSHCVRSSLKSLFVRIQGLCPVLPLCTLVIYRVLLFSTVTFCSVHSHTHT